MGRELQRTEPKSVTVTIHIQSKQHPNSLPRKTEGQLQRIGDSIYLSYSEDEQDMGQTTSRYKCELEGAKGFTLIRSGDISMRQQFLPGQITFGRYESPYGTFQMETDTRHAIFHWDGNTGEIKLDYRLRMGNEALGRFRIHIQFNSEKDE